MNIHKAPAGTRDLLPLEVKQKRWISDRLEGCFSQWGYQPIITSTLDGVKALTAGGAIDRSTLIQVENILGERLGLRPEMTASIARAAVTRMGGSPYPKRLYYHGNVFRRSPDGYYGRQVEFYQMGVELLFAEGSLADTEILCLLLETLKGLNLEDWHLILGEAGLTGALLSEFPDNLRGKVRYCLANLDRIGLEQLSLSPELKERALFLFDLRGKPLDVLSKVSALDLEEKSRKAVENLKNLVDRLYNQYTEKIPLVLDLSLVETIDYYTGIVFEVVASKNYQYRVLGKGGRYDGLLELYDPQGTSNPGIGFALNMENLYNYLLSLEILPDISQTADYLVIPETPQAEEIAFAYAQHLRESKENVQVEMELRHRTPEAIIDYARLCEIKQLVWVKADGTTLTESLENT